ncbi:MAG: hypothetical protein IPM74_19050 [Crocinitomicaceae bacterium]|nr:hypothetical protein [Crocinitomicaceae bacterium]
MIKKTAEYRTPLILLLLLILVQSFRTDLNNPYKKPIAGDAQGYYAYLPALFIYHDPHYGFVEKINETYYVPANSKSFVNEVDGQKVNKTFPGVAVLYFPFFAAAHGISYIAGLPVDGYAYTYQLFFLIGFWVYMLAGMIYFKKSLQLCSVKPLLADLSLLVMVMGTNIFFYSVFDQSVTHIHNFFLICFAVYHALQLKNNFSRKSIIFLVAALCLLVIIRPTNVLAVGLVIFFIPDFNYYKSLLKKLFSVNVIFYALPIMFVILAVPPIIWKMQTGNWIVYSYGKEGFNFLSPEIFNFLFSYTKGWFLYTPLMLLILVGGFLLVWRKNRSQFLIGITLFALLIYIFSSWWCWYYGAGMSQRVMIDFYLIPGYLFALMIQWLATKSNFLKFSFTTLFILGIIFNQVQAFQIAHGILPFGSPTQAQYWDQFLSLKKKALIYPPAHWQKISSGQVDLNPISGHVIKGNSVLIEQDWALQSDEKNQYSAVATTDSISFKKGDKLIFSFDARAETEITESRIVFVLDSTHSHVFFVKKFIQTSWEKMQFKIEPDFQSTSPIEVFIWNAGTSESMSLKNLRWELYYSAEYF